jgi:hypothetical protein
MKSTVIAKSGMSHRPNATEEKTWKFCPTAAGFTSWRNNTGPNGGPEKPATGIELSKYGSTVRTMRKPDSQRFRKLHEENNFSKINR